MHPGILSHQISDMTKYELQHRTKRFHVNVINCCLFFPGNTAGFETARQLIQSAGSVGANYRSACRGKSKADFTYKIEVVLEEADESLYWLEVTKEAMLLPGDKQEQLDILIKEATELVCIFNAADITAKKNRYLSNSKISKSQNKQ